MSSDFQRNIVAGRGIVATDQIKVAMKKYMTILIDPPWPLELRGKYKSHLTERGQLDYPTMTVEQIIGLPISSLADDNCHVWLWTTNQHLHDGFHALEAWGLNYLAPVTFEKPSGIGNYFIHVTQTVLFAYKRGCHFPMDKYLRTLLPMENPRRHSQKPHSLQDYIEMISPEPRIELFARNRRMGWDVWGNEVESDLELKTK